MEFFICFIAWMVFAGITFGLLHESLKEKDSSPESLLVIVFLFWPVLLGAHVVDIIKK